ncbi:TfoX/Sxy family protein [Clostridium beijerinckii]|uniref:TfoX/Sxy family protein n=1 Tax=Clostridium beijerinckii TaxID=1520 RepID=UPI000479EE4A|nr:TfoX/Sxy family protein [Clostridium beijerinckii]
MASNIEFVEYVCEQISGAGSITYRKMFGDYGIYCNKKIIGLICDNQFFEEDGSFHKEENDFNGHNGFNRNNLKNLLSEMEFKEIESNTFYNGEKLVGENRVKYSLFLMTGRK